MTKMKLFSLLLLASIFASCSVSKQISRQANTLLLKDSAIAQGHIGISIFEPATGKYWYEHNAEKYFVPASNTKLFSLYAGMKYLGDSLNGFQIHETADSIYFKANGDPTFLLPEYKNQLFLDHLKKSGKKIAYSFDQKQLFKGPGRGWAWDDYQSYYTAERSQMPVYGNIVTFSVKDKKLQALPSLFLTEELSLQLQAFEGKYYLGRRKDENKFFADKSSSLFTKDEIPFITDASQTIAISILEDALQLSRQSISIGQTSSAYKNFKTQAADSMFKPMMHRSDNFFAEQTLLMTSNAVLGYMSERAIVDTILKGPLAGIPQLPRWVDGSGLSRYNLFTPQSLVWLLQKLQNEFGMQRMQNILPTGGEGTLSSYYKDESGFIFAKTGTLSNNCALSGYLITKKNKLLIFSVLANNYQTSATPVRRAVEKFLKGLREQY